MSSHVIYSTFIFLAFIACNSSINYTTSKNVEQKKPVLSNTTKAGFSDTIQSKNQQYANIVGISIKGETYYIDADYIQYLTGQAAIDAAVKAHQADTFKTEDGKTHIHVPNDYFIVNESKKIRRLELAKNCAFDLIINPDRTPVIHDNSIESFKKIYRESPFILTLSNNGIVTNIKELFLP